MSLAEQLPDLIVHLRRQKEVKSKMGAISVRTLARVFQMVCQAGEIPGAPYHDM